MIKIKTPAKINITLEMLGKRGDGFHELQSIMYAVNLHDFITIERADKIEISGNSTGIPYDNSNLCHKAAELFFKETAIKSGATIYIEKNIPVSAGLGGGSSNAAGALRGLNELFNYPLSTEKLKQIAQKIGSDVAFFIEGGAQLATGRGEKLEKISRFPKLNIVIVKPKSISISTAKVYKVFSELKEKPKKLNTNAIVQNLNNVDFILNNLNNHLEEALKKDYPQLFEIKDYLIKQGCIASLVSGSGSSVFGIYSGQTPIIGLNNCDVFYC